MIGFLDFWTVSFWDFWACLMFEFLEFWICLIATHLSRPKDPKIQRLKEAHEVQKSKIQRSKKPKVWNLLMELPAQLPRPFQRFGFLGFWIFGFLDFGEGAPLDGPASQTAPAAGVRRPRGPTSSGVRCSRLGAIFRASWKDTDGWAPYLGQAGRHSNTPLGT